MRDISSGNLPLPPLPLASRVGSMRVDDPWGLYDQIGRASVRDLLAGLPASYSLSGRRILDFGCGAGRTLRHFVADETEGEFWGCDIDAESIAWLQEHLSPPVVPFLNDELPPLRQADETFDLIYCVSVFTHLSRSWSAWLLELHRVLKPGGLLLATFMGEGQSRRIAQEEWDENRVGMLTLRAGQSWESGGPMIMHSPWWIREHWGRLFDVVSLTPAGFASPDPALGHGLVTLSKKEVALTPAELEELSDDPRETLALAHNVEHLVRDMEYLRHSFDSSAAELAEQRERADALERDLAQLTTSRSWRLTHSLRRLAATARGAQRNS